MGTKRELGYKITNWREYNESLVNRGDITVWFNEDAVESWQHPNDSTKVGRPFTYSDTAIECLLTSASCSSCLIAKRKVLGVRWRGC